MQIMLNKVKYSLFSCLQETECSTAVAGRAYLNMGTKLQLPDDEAEADVAEDDSAAIVREEVVLVAGVAVRTPRHFTSM